MLKRRVGCGIIKKALLCVYKKQHMINTDWWISALRWVHSPLSIRRWEENNLCLWNTHSSILNTDRFSWNDQACFDQSDAWLFAGLCILLSVVHQCFWFLFGIFLDDSQQSFPACLMAAFVFCTHFSVFYKTCGHNRHVAVRGPLSESPPDLQSFTSVNKNSKDCCRWHQRNLSIAPDQQRADSVNANGNFEVINDNQL